MKLLILAMTLALFLPATALANDISVTINGTAVDFGGQGPAIVDGRTLVPVRAVFEALDFDVDWDATTQIVTLTRDDFIVQVIIGSAAFGITQLIPGLEASGVGAIDVPAQIIGGRTLLPIRAVLEAVGYYVDWDAATQTVLVSSEPFEEQAQIEWQQRAAIWQAWFDISLAEWESMEGFEALNRPSPFAEIFAHPTASGVLLLFWVDIDDDGNRILDDYPAMIDEMPLYVVLGVNSITMGELQEIFGEDLQIWTVEGGDERHGSFETIINGQVVLAEGFMLNFWTGDENDIVTHAGASRAYVGN